jgi:hypothetical protein
MLNGEIEGSTNDKGDKMWVFTSGGFVSAVQLRSNEDMLMVRARDRQSLETMLEGIELAGAANDEVFERPEIVSVPGDYRYRVTVSKATFVLFLQFEVLNYLNYDNFKNALTASRGKEWHDAAMGVWVKMLAVDDGPKEEVTERNSAWGLQEDWTLGSEDDESFYEELMKEEPNA